MEKCKSPLGVYSQWTGMDHWTDVFFSPFLGDLIDSHWLQVPSGNLQPIAKW